jgi:site-specific recombinase XerD
MMKGWAAEVGITERVATHTLRKTFARTHLDRGAKITTIMHCLNHSSKRQTLGYLGLLAKDVAELYADAI